jgi:membrane-associated phospholipid phosphatase
MGWSARDRDVSVGEVAAVVGGAALLTGSWIVVALRDDVPPLEQRVFAAVNGLPASLWPVLWAPVQLGSFAGSLVVTVATAALTRRRRLTVAVMGASQAAYWSAKGVKRVVRRGRPAHLLVDVAVRERTTGLGFVSGHSAVAFALATALAPELPRRARGVSLVLAAVVAGGRVYAGAHLPLDVVGGIGMGVIAGVTARWGLGLGGVGVPRRDEGAMAR